ncbi:MAG: hypothetical protein Q8K45_14260 [Rubrivivax sp.]|nr:hypothetical protein [Rubrivivax sp.]
MIILIWCLTGLLLLLWSLAGWALHALLTAGPAWLSRLPALLQDLPQREWLEGWWPGWQDTVLLAADALQWSLGWLAGAGAVVAWFVWAVWAFGALLALALAALLSYAARRLPAPQRDATAAGRSATG